jgi:6-phosphogluconate dehydrogenase (decarboxylating)
MQAYAEGLDLLRHKKEFGLDLLQVGQIWQFGSVIRSWLLDLTVDALSKNPTLQGIEAGQSSKEWNSEWPSRRSRRRWTTAFARRIPSRLPTNSWQ